MKMFFENYSLKKHNSFRVEAEARYFFEFTSLNLVAKLLIKKEFAKLPKLIIGGGNNILFTKNFDGLVLQSKNTDIQIIKETTENVYLRCGAGLDWDSLVQFTVDNNWSGLENLSAIPGTVGAAPVQNIGAYGVEVSDSIIYIESLNIKYLQVEILPAKDCNFSYRNSFFKTKNGKENLIASVVFRLNKKHSFSSDYGEIRKELKDFSEINLQNIRQAIINIRKQKLPATESLPNAGSYFKNPIISNEKLQELHKKFPNVKNFPAKGEKHKLSAAQLIDLAGWKGTRHKNVGVYEKHALILVNYGSETGREISELANKIQADVTRKFGVDLVPEVNQF